MIVANISAEVFNPLVSLPGDSLTNSMMVMRWVHFIAAITWIGLLYFFNLVNVPFMREADASTRSKAMALMMPRAMWWFRTASVVTVLMGIGYWSSIVSSDAANAPVHANTGLVFGKFFGLWTVVWALMYVPLKIGKGIFDKGAFLAVYYSAILLGAAWLFLTINHHGWESNRLLAIGIGGGFGWVMMFNVWGVIWRIQKRLIEWNKKAAADGSPIPAQAGAMMRTAFLASRTSMYMSFPLLFLMGAASHYPMFAR